MSVPGSIHESITSLQFTNGLESDNSDLVRNAFLRFLAAASPLRKNPIQQSNIVINYVEDSKDCNEIFTAWDNLGTHHAKTNPIVLEVLSIIITVCNHNRSHRSTAMSIIRRVVRQRMRSVYSCLGSESASHVKGALFFLGAAVRNSPSASKEIVNTFNFSFPALSKLPSRRNQKEYYDIRTLFIEFIISILAHNDATSIQAIIDTNKHCITAMFKLISKDHLQLSRDVLNVVEVILANPDISKTTKLNILNSQSLDQVSRMYSSTEEIEVSLDSCAHTRPDVKTDAKTNATSTTITTTGRDVAHEFLMRVCSSSTAGIVFTGKTSTQAKLHNPVLLKFLHGLTKANSDPLVQQLVLNILKCSPDTVHGYMSNSIYTIEARASLRLLSTTNLYVKVLTLPLPESVTFGLSQLTTTFDMGETFADYIVPACMKGNVIAQGLQSSSLLVKSATMSIVVSSLTKASVALCSSSVSESVQRVCRESLVKRLPGFQVVMEALQQSRVKYQEVISKPKSGDGEGVVGVKLIYFRALQMVKMYLRCFPGALKVNRYDLGKIVHAEVFEVGFDNQLMGALVAVLLEATDIKWAYQRRRGIGIYASLLGEFLALMVSTKYSAVYTLLRRLLTKVIERTGIFANVISEVPLWLNIVEQTHIKKCDKDVTQGLPKATVILLFEEALMLAYADPYVYFDRLGSLVSSQDHEHVPCLSNDLLQFERAGAAESPFSPLLFVVLNRYTKELTGIGKKYSNDNVTEAFTLTILASLAKSGVPLSSLFAAIQGIGESIGDHNDKTISTLNDSKERLFSHCCLSNNPNTGRVVLWCLRLIHDLCVRMAAIGYTTLSHSQLVYLFGILLPDSAKSIVSTDVTAAIVCLMADWVDHNNKSSNGSKLTNSILQPLVGLIVSQIIKTVNDMEHNTHEWDTEYAKYSMLLSSMLNMFGSRGNVPGANDLLAKILALPMESLQKTRGFFVISLLSVLTRVMVIPAQDTSRLLNLMGLGMKNNQEIEETLWRMFQQNGGRWQREFSNMPISGVGWFMNMINNSNTSKAGVHILVCMLRFNRAYVRRIDEYLLISEQSLGRCAMLHVQFFPMWVEFMRHRHSKPLPSKLYDALLGGMSERFHSDHVPVNKHEKELFGMLVQHALKSDTLTSIVKQLPLEQNEWCANKWNMLIILFNEMNAFTEFSIKNVDMIAGVINGCLEKFLCSSDNDIAFEAVSLSVRCLEYVVSYGVSAKSNTGDRVKEICARLVAAFVGESAVSLCARRIRCLRKFLLLVHPAMRARNEIAGVSQSGWISIGDVYGTLLAHPSVDRVLSQSETEPRLSLLKMILSLVTHCDMNDLSTDQVRKFMHSYTATMSMCDQTTVEIFHQYERKGHAIASVAYVWGESYADKSAFADSMGHIGAKSTASLDCFDSKKMLTSVRSFPFNRALWDDVNTHTKPATFKREDPPESVYDPAYVLPLLMRVFQSADDVDIRRLIETHTLGYIIQSLSSNDQNVRMCGSAVLRQLFDTHLQHSNFREHSQVKHLLSVLRDGIENSNERVPALISVFICEALLVLISPDHALYVTINKFMLMRPFLPLDDIPLFYNLLLSGEDTGIAQQNWMLRWLAFGLVNAEDWTLYKRRHVAELLFSLSDSRLSTKTTRLLVADVFAAASHIPFVANDLFKHAGLAPWLFSKTSIVEWDLSPIHRAGVPFDTPAYCRTENRDNFIDSLQIAALVWRHIDERCHAWPLVREAYQSLLTRAIRWIEKNGHTLPREMFEERVDKLIEVIHDLLFTCESEVSPTPILLEPYIMVVFVRIMNVRGIQSAEYRPTSIPTLIDKIAHKSNAKRQRQGEEPFLGPFTTHCLVRIVTIATLTSVPKCMYIQQKRDEESFECRSVLWLLDWAASTVSEFKYEDKYASTTLGFLLNAVRPLASRGDLVGESAKVALADIATTASGSAVS
eukprot:CFRG0578T1